MLKTEAVERKLFEYLKEFMADPFFANFALVGGTSLALRFAYRKSIDIDLFTLQPFDPGAVEAHIREKYPQFLDISSAANTLIGSIDGIKIDFIAFQYNMVKPIEQIDGIRMWSIYDIAAMKLHAIADDGTRLKDFVDIAFLSTQMSFSQMINSYKVKFPQVNPLRVFKSITYFADIDTSVSIQRLEKTGDWLDYQKQLQKMVEFPDTIFSLHKK